MRGKLIFYFLHRANRSWNRTQFGNTVNFSKIQLRKNIILKLIFYFRVGFGLLALDNGYKAYQMYKRTPIFETRIEEYGKSVGMILCVGTDILAGTTGSSLVAHLGLGVLSATGFGLGAYVIFTVTRRAIKNYKETGKIDKNDVLSIVSASLMCGNFAMKLGTAGALILSSEKLQKFPLLRELSSKINNSNNKLTVCVNNLSDVVNRADNFINNYAGLISICSNFTKSALEYANGKKNFSDFKNDCGKFCNDLVKELFHQAWPMLKKYVPKNLANLTDLMYRYIVEKFDVFKIKKWLDEKIQLNTIINNLLKKVLNREKIFEGINATITRVTKKLLKKISIDEEKNIDKIIKTEVFVERAILTNMFQKLQISWNLRQFESIDPNLLKKAFDDSVKDFENRFNESDFIEEFCKYYNDDDHFILLTSRDSCDFYVFQNRTVQSVVKEFNNSCYKMKKEDNIYIITYYYTNQKLVLYFDDSDKSNIVGYVVAENMN